MVERLQQGVSMVSYLSWCWIAAFRQQSACEGVHAVAEGKVGEEPDLLSQ